MTKRLEFGPLIMLLVVLGIPVWYGIFLLIDWMVGLVL